MTPTFPQSETNTCKTLIGNITQTSGTGTPIGHTFVNTIQSSAWTRAGVGLYQKLTGTIWQDNLAYMSPCGTKSTGATASIPLTNAGVLVGYYTIYASEYLDKLIITLETVNTLGVATDLFNLIGSTTLSHPEIRLYTKYLS